jgi:hypothetical protein
MQFIWVVLHVDSYGQHSIESIHVSPKEAYQAIVERVDEVNSGPGSDENKWKLLHSEPPASTENYMEYVKIGQPFPTRLAIQRVQVHHLKSGDHDSPQPPECGHLFIPNGNLITSFINTDYS